jgi:hypothetical protein
MQGELRVSEREGIHKLYNSTSIPFFLYSFLNHKRQNNLRRKNPVPAKVSGDFPRREITTINKLYLASFLSRGEAGSEKRKGPRLREKQKEKEEMESSLAVRTSEKLRSAVRAGPSYLATTENHLFWRETAGGGN